MERFAVCVNDADHAQRVLKPLLASAAGATHCVVVVCVPRLGWRIGRWLAPAARQQWRQDWAAQLSAALAPALALAAPAVSTEWLVASGPLSSVTRGLRQQHGAGLRLVDARRPQPGAVAEPLMAGPAPARARFGAPVAVASSLSLVLALTD